MEREYTDKEEKGLYREVKKDIHEKGTSTKRKPHEKGQEYIQKKRENNTE